MIRNTVNSEGGRKSDDLNITDFVGLVVEKWRIVSLITVTLTLIAAAFAFLVQPIYRSETLLAPVEANDAGGGLSALASQFGGVASLAGFNLDGAGEVADRWYALLTSRHFSAMFIEEFDLLPVFFAEQWDEEAAQWKPAYADSPPSMADAVKMFEDEIRAVSEDSATGFVSVAIEWHDPAVAAEWANSLVALLNSYIRTRDTLEAERSIEYLRKEYESTSIAEIRSAISNLIEQQIRNAMTANVRDDYAYEVLDPAVPSDPDDPERPKKLLVIFTGFLLGFLLSLVFVLVTAGRRFDGLRAN